MPHLNAAYLHVCCHCDCHSSLFGRSWSRKYTVFLGSDASSRLSSFARENRRNGYVSDDETRSSLRAGLFLIAETLDLVGGGNAVVPRLSHHKCLSANISALCDGATWRKHVCDPPRCLGSVWGSFMQGGGSFLVVDCGWPLLLGHSSPTRSTRRSVGDRICPSTPAAIVSRFEGRTTEGAQAGHCIWPLQSCQRIFAAKQMTASFLGSARGVSLV